MSQFTDHDKTLALCGIYQAAKLVYDYAATGKTDEQAFQTSINSLFVTNPEKTLDVYGDDVQNLQLGVKTLLGQMGSHETDEVRNLEITRYVLSMIILEKNLAKQPQVLQQVARVLQTAQNQREHFGDWHENVMASISRAYTENISKIKPIIMVRGHQQHLTNPLIANKIRSLLLAGVRSAMLWRQVGGSRWGLILGRKKYLKQAQTLYRNDHPIRGFFQPK
jgi:high frequency lysogenization protein